MIIAWNVRELNKVENVREITSRLFDLKHDIAILIETRVKKNKTENIRNKLKLRGNYLDNYNKHDNGRIWDYWNDKNMGIKMVSNINQMIHCGVYDLSGNWMYKMTTIYVMNFLEKRKKLWKDIEYLIIHQQGHWFIMGDFNNVLKIQDKFGGRIVTEGEYSDLSKMMDIIGLYEMGSVRYHYTWSNKQSGYAIYSRIDRVIGNLDWLQKHCDYTFKIMQF